jgi:hypothetical protein
MFKSKWSRGLAIAVIGLTLPLFAAAKARVTTTRTTPVSSKSAVVAHAPTTTAKHKALSTPAHAKAKAPKKTLSVKSSKTQATKLHAKPSKASKLVAKSQAHRALTHKPAPNKD